jgi:hypothetical protein
VRTSLVTVDLKEKVNAKIREKRRFTVSLLHRNIFLGVQNLRSDHDTHDFVTIRVVFKERIQLRYHGVSVLSFYSERNTENDLLLCMLLVSSQAVGVRQNCLLYGRFF